MVAVASRARDATRFGAGVVNGHAARETRTNSGSLVIVCECGWRTAPHGVVTFDRNGARKSAYSVVVDELLREHGRHALTVGGGRSER